MAHKYHEKSLTDAIYSEFKTFSPENWDTDNAIKHFDFAGKVYHVIFIRK